MEENTMQLRATDSEEDISNHAFRYNTRKIQTAT